MPDELKYNENHKEILDKIHESNQSMLRYWETRLEEARGNVEYWIGQVNASSVLSTRILLKSWEKIN